MRSKYEKKAQKELESQGWLVDWKIRPRIVPRTYNVDYFGLFDLIAVRAGDPVRWISIKPKHAPSRNHQKEVKEFYLPMGNQKEIWWWTKTGKLKRKLYM